MGPRIGVGDVVNIFQSIWAKLREPTISQGFTCKLPPFDGHLDYASSPDIETCGSSSRRSSSTDARLQWYVQEKKGDGFLKLSLKRTEFCGQKNDDYFCGDNIPITTIDDGKYKPTQYEEFGYNPPEAAQSSSGHREDPPVDDRQANYSVSNVSESPEERPRQDSPTINLDAERGIFRGYDSRMGISTTTTNDNFTIGWPLLNMSFRDIHQNAPERHEGRHSGSNRVGRSAEEVRGHGDQPIVRMPRGRYERLEPDAFRRYQPQMYMPPGPDSRLGFHSDHRHQNPAYNQGGREPVVVETFGNYPRQSLDDQHFQGQEVILDNPLEYQAATSGLTYEADNSPSLDSFLEMNDLEGEASHFSNSRPGQDPPQSSHGIYQDAIRSPSSSPELSHGQPGDLTKDDSEVSPLHDQFGKHQQAYCVSDLAPFVYTGMSDQLNYQDHSTGGLRWPTSRNDSAFSKFRGMKHRISSRLRRF